MFDAVIIGGGPAGATAGRLLAEWGYSVEIRNAPAGNRPSMAECLPPSDRKLFQFLGILDAVDAAGFLRSTGNTVWWGGEPMRVEPYPDGFGYQVVRRDFDRLLLDLARAAGARVRVQRVRAMDECRGRFILNCSGRLFHVKQENRPARVALWGIWTNKANFRLPDQSHTLVESYEGGWAWSVPVSPFIRHVAFMLKPGARYGEQITKTKEFRQIFAGVHWDGKSWGREATVSRAAQFCGPGWLLVGDAASTIDPLSSFGVKKAMTSAWVAAVVVNTCLKKPEMRDVALRFYEEREEEVWEGYRAQSAAWYGEERRDPIEEALADLKRRPAVRIRRVCKVPVEMRAAIEGREIVLKDDLVTLAELAEHYPGVGEMFEAYRRVCPSETLPGFLRSLSALLAKGVLVHI